MLNTFLQFQGKVKHHFVCEKKNCNNLTLINQTLCQNITVVLPYNIK